MFEVLSQGWYLIPYLLLTWAFISGLGIAVGFHRVYSHKTHELKPWLDWLVLTAGTLGGQGSSISWTAVHRGYHHRYSDTEKDLHSPKLGILHALVGWYWNVNETTINHKYAVDLLRKPLHVRVHKHYFKFLFGAMLGMLTFDMLFNTQVLTVYGAALFISILQDNLVNVLCHQPKLGYRNFVTNDNSNNFWPLGYLGWGQGWHNSHHNNPKKFLFGEKWWEVDPCFIFLPLLKWGSIKAK